MAGDVIAVDAISCWAECQPVPPCHHQAPHLTGLQRLLAIQPDQTTGYGL